MEPGTQQVFPYPISRSDHPITSHRAGEELRETGEADRQCAIVLDLVKVHPRFTSRELSTFTTAITRHDVASRLSELKAAGKVHNPGKVRCSITGKLALTWDIGKGEACVRLCQ